MLVNYAVVDVAVGYRHSLALTEGGVVWGWGCGEVSANGFQRTTGGDDGYSRWFDDRTVPTEILTLSGKGVKAIAAGSDMSMALTSTGEVFTWGANGDAGGGKGAPSLPARVLWK